MIASFIIALATLALLAVFFGRPKPIPDEDLSSWGHATEQLEDK